MEVTYIVVVILGLLGRVLGEESTTEIPTTIESTTENNETEVTTESKETEVTTTEEPTPSFGSPGLFGGFYYNTNVKNPYNVHYIHGSFQAPQTGYYTRHNFFRDEGSDNTFDYYLDFGVSRMTDRDFRYHDFHYFYHDLNRTIEENETLPSDFIIACHPNATAVCPENTETVCLRNGTIYCMSKISVVVPCEGNTTMNCVNTIVPCVCDCIRFSGNFEPISLPCLATVTIEDVYENHKGETLSHVGGTFVVVKAWAIEEKTFCVTVVVDPLAPEDQFS